jgi:hypothetical protein
MTSRLLALLACMPLAATLGCLPDAPADASPDKPFPPVSQVANAKTTGPPEGVSIDNQEHRVVRRNADGNLAWSTPLDGYLGRGGPDLFGDAERVYLAHNHGVTSLDHATGRILWHSDGPSDTLLLSDGLLLASECSNDDDVAAQGRWFVARTAAAGREVFRVQLPQKDFDPEDVREVTGLFLVQDNWRRKGGPTAFLIDREGWVRLSLDRQVVAGRAVEDDRLFLTRRDVIRVAPSGTIRWSVPFQGEDTELDRGGIVELPGGDLLAFLYGGIWDSGWRSSGSTRPPGKRLGGRPPSRWE